MELLSEELFLREDIKDAPKKIWLTLWRLAGRAEKTLSGLSKRTLANLCRTSEATVYHRLKGAEDAGLLKIDWGPAMTIRVLDPSYLLTSEPNAPNPPASKPTRPTPLFDGQEAPDILEMTAETSSEISAPDKNENGNGFGNEKRSCELGQYINSFKERNKKIKQVLKKTPPCRAVETVASPDETSGGKWSQAREWVSRTIWERGMARDLVDLMTLALVRNWIGRRDIERWVKSADDARRDFDRTDGRTGKNCRWATLRNIAATVYAERGVAFPCCNGLAPEPKPEPALTPTPKVDGPARVETPAETPADIHPDDGLLDGWDFDAEEDLDTTTRRVRERYRISGIEATAKAWLIRDRIRRLKHVA